MAMRLTVENVNGIEKEMLDTMDLYGLDSEQAKSAANYIAGIHDMANAVRQAIRELGGS